MAELTTQGEGQVERPADRAELHLRYTTRANDRDAAVAALTTLVAGAEVILAWEGVTVASRRMSTSELWENRRRSGTSARQVYRVEIVDVSRLDDVLSDLLATNPTSVDGPTWDLADKIGPYREAQALAVADAKASAQGYADALGVRLGPLVRVDDSGGHPIPMVAAAAAPARASASRPDIAELALAPEPIVVPARCSITWQLLD